MTAPILKAGRLSIRRSEVVRHAALSRSRSPVRGPRIPEVRRNSGRNVAGDGPAESLSARSADFAADGGNVDAKPGSRSGRSCGRARARTKDRTSGPTSPTNTFHKRTAAQRPQSAAIGRMGHGTRGRQVAEDRSSRTFREGGRVQVHPWIHSRRGVDNFQIQEALSATDIRNLWRRNERVTQSSSKGTLTLTRSWGPDVPSPACGPVSPHAISKTFVDDDDGRSRETPSMKNRVQGLKVGQVVQVAP